MEINLIRRAMNNSTTHIETEQHNSSLQTANENPNLSLRGSKQSQKLVPKLRFKEFDGEWENTRLFDLSDLITKGTTPKRYTNSGVNFIKIEGLVGVNINKEKCFCIDEETHQKELKRSILEEDDLLFAIAGATVGKVGIVTSDILPANTNQALAIIRLKNKEYLNYILQILQSRVMKKYIYQSVSVGAQPNLNLEQIGDFRFNLPSLPEQQKIASFLSAVDEKIQQLSKKKELLEDYKKGVMQQLFSGKLRFKDGNGKEYPEWEEKRLGEIAIIKMGQSPESKSYNTDGLGMLLIQGNADIKGRITAPRQWTREPTKTCEIDDLILTVRAPVGAVSKSCHNACIGRGVCSIINNKHSNKEYLFQFLLNYEDKWGRLEQGSTFTAVSGSDIKTIKLDVPCLEEQQKIANYLSAIDSKIESVGNQISQTQSFKKGLLQQMFV